MKHFIKLFSCKLSLTIQRNMTSIFNAEFFYFLQTSFSLKSFNIRKPIKFKGKISESVNITLYFFLRFYLRYFHSNKTYPYTPKSTCIPLWVLFPWLLQMLSLRQVIGQSHNGYIFVSLFTYFKASDIVSIVNPMSWAIKFGGSSPVCFIKILSILKNENFGGIIQPNGYLMNIQKGIKDISYTDKQKNFKKIQRNFSIVIFFVSLFHFITWIRDGWQIQNRSVASKIYTCCVDENNLS